MWSDPDELWLGVLRATELGWSVPNGLLHRLSPDSTLRLLAGESWQGLPLSTDNPQDSKPYRVHAAGTLLAITAEAFDVAPPDPRFVKWGSEDDAWALALRTLVGKPWRGDADLVHLWHPAEARKSRVTGNENNRQLLRRYKACGRSADLMRGLIEEAKAWHPSTSDPTAVASGRS